MNNTYYIVKTLDSEIESKDIFTTQLLLEASTGVLSNQGVNMTNHFLVLKESGKFRIIGSILEEFDNSECYEYTYRKLSVYDKGEISNEEIEKLFLKENDELIEVQNNKIVVMEKNG